MSDNTDQQPPLELVVSAHDLPHVAQELPSTGIDFFAVVEKGSTKSGTPRPGLSKEQLASLPPAVQTAVEKQSLSAWRDAVATMPAAEVENMLTFVDKAGAEVRIQQDVVMAPLGFHRAAQALLKKLQEDLEKKKKERQTKKQEAESD